MVTSATSPNLAAHARRRYADELAKGLGGVQRAVADAALALRDRPAEHALAQRRRAVSEEVVKSVVAWHDGLLQGLQQAQNSVSSSAVRPTDLPPPGRQLLGDLSLVDDDTIEREILGSRLSLAIMDRASWEFSDLRSRISVLEGREELEAHDMLRAHVVARIAIDAWRRSALSLDAWRELQQTLHEEVSLLVAEAYHETNRWLVEQGVLPEVDLRPMIRRARSAVGGAGGGGSGGGTASQPGALQTRLGGPGSGGNGGNGGEGGGTGGQGGQGGSGRAGGGVAAGGGDGLSAGDLASRLGGLLGAASGSSAAGPGGAGGRWAPSGRDTPATGVHEETRLMTRSPGMARMPDPAEAVLGRLNRLIGRQLPAFADTAQAQPASARLREAIDRVEDSVRQEAEPAAGAPAQAPTAPAMLEQLEQRKRTLKDAAETPIERATIEIVALLFQSILTEERIPASVRVWFARLQMPVLRVAISEPDFFATVEHPARRLIDRMGACVMGFDATARAVGDALEKEIKRVVQVVEAYPDTGRRVFQTVLTEFERFLEHYFRIENEASRKGVSLAQQVEQRETLAIQYTIELRKMLESVPVQEGVRQFLFQVWADVLAMTAVKSGAQAEDTKTMKRAAADLIWSAGAKVSREERAEVIRRLPPLLKTLREGMALAGLSPERQDEQIHVLNNALAAAFTAKSAIIPTERLEELMERLETLEELLPDAEMQIDESMVLDLSGHESSELEVVTSGGSMPTPAMIAWARELQVGSWYMLDYRGRNEAVQLAWQGMRKQLSLFVTAQGRCVLFQQQRLASFLQAGLLLPAQDEALTVRATRTALAKLDVDPGILG